MPWKVIRKSCRPVWGIWRSPGRIGLYCLPCVWLIRKGFVHLVWIEVQHVCIFWCIARSNQSLPGWIFAFFLRPPCPPLPLLAVLVFSGISSHTFRVKTVPVFWFEVQLLACPAIHRCHRHETVTLPSGFMTTSVVFEHVRNTPGMVSAMSIRRMKEVGMDRALNPARTVSLPLPYSPDSTPAPNWVVHSDEDMRPSVTLLLVVLFLAFIADNHVTFLPVPLSRYQYVRPWIPFRENLVRTQHFLHNPRNIWQHPLRYARRT